MPRTAGKDRLNTFKPVIIQADNKIFSFQGQCSISRFWSEHCYPPNSAMIDPAVLDDNNPDPLNFLLYFSKHGEGPKTTVKAYNDTDIAKQYSKCCRLIVYGAPQRLADMAAAVTSQNQDKSNVKVIDIGSGTGEIGYTLNAAGFTNITAHDGAQAMVETCRATGYYNNYVCAFLDGPNSLPIPSDTYDLATSSAVIIPQHVPVRAMEELARIVKPGGHVILSARVYTAEEFAGEYDQMASSLEERGIWKRYGCLQYPDYNKYFPGQIDIFTVL